MSQRKHVAVEKAKKGKKVPPAAKTSTIGMTPIWRFDQLDLNGKFRFDLHRGDFDHVEVLSKLVNYGNMKWSEIDAQTHDRRNRSKHHYLCEGELSADAVERIRAMHMEEDTDTIFSFSLMNKLRIIGTRKNGEFHVIWYDPEHEFCPSSK